jgi:hypothetical protein
MEFLFSYGWRRAFQPLPVPVFPSGSVELMPQPKGVFLYCGGRCPILAGHGCAPEWCPAYNTHPAKVNCGLRLASCGRMKTTEKTKKTAVVDLPWVKQGRANSKRRASARSFISVASNKNRKRNHPTSRCSSQSAILSGSYRHSRPMRYRGTLPARDHSLRVTGCRFINLHSSAQVNAVLRLRR